MISDPQAARMVMWHARPGTLVLTAAIGILFLAWGDFTPGTPRYWFSVVIGLAVGLPAVVFSRWYMRRYADVYVEKLVKRSRTRGSRSDRIVGSIYYLVPALPVLTIFAITELRELPFQPALGVLAIMLILLYPEQKQIYQAAKTELIKMYSGEPED